MRVAPMDVVIAGVVVGVAISLSVACFPPRSRDELRLPDTPQLSVRNVAPPISPGKIRIIGPPPGAMANRLASARFWIGGNGTCGKMRVYFGDGSSSDFTNLVLDNTWPIDHTYEGWGGTKTVTVEGLENCTDAAHTSVSVTPTSLVVVHFPAVAYFPGTGCGNVLLLPFVRQGSTVHLTSPNVGSVDPNGFVLPGINFGGTDILTPDNFLDADGESTPASADYPFPGMRKNSLVLRLIQQVVQGGKNITFVADQTGLLEFCINHRFPTGYKSGTMHEGFWRYYIEVTEPAF